MTSPDQDGKIFVGKGADDAYLLFALANRHGLATGATGTGKTGRRDFRAPASRYSRPT